MKTERNIFIAFILNLAFSVFEFAGGILTGSVAIASDAIHDLGDAFSIGISYFLEKISKKQPDEQYTYGYARYSVLGSVISTLFLLFGSAAVIFNAIRRIIEPTEIHYNGMILFAVFGVCVNAGAAYLTSRGDSLNQKAINLHMLEDVLGWLIVLVGALVMRFTDFTLIDPLLSIGVAAFILVNAARNLKSALDLFLEKTPHGIDVREIKEHIIAIDGILDVHHIHIWSLDGEHHYATMHIVTNTDAHEAKEKIRQKLREHGITHVTLELESGGHCCEKTCSVKHPAPSHHHHSHHH